MSSINTSQNTHETVFDLIKDDFDYYVISVVCSALILASYVTKKLSQRKMLKQAWR